MAFQRERPEDLADGLVDHGALTEAQARACLAEYHNSLQQMGGLGHRPVGLRTG
jgi:hypothetical protein